MERLINYEDMIIAELKTFPETRDSDRLLTMRIWHDFYGINEWDPVADVMKNDKLPSIESLGRVRRKIQARDESLRGTRRKEKIRMDAQADYIEYSLSDTM